MSKRIGIINSGGDCPGLNAVIASIVKAGTNDGYEFLGFIHGYEGMLGEPRYKVLDRAAVKGITHLGGTILKTTNKGHFISKVGAGDKATVSPEVLAESKANLDKLGVEALIVIGGDGTLSSALQVNDYGIPVVGVPKSIDNDLRGTEQTFGFSTAIDIVTEALDRVHTTAVSHERVMIVEVMGRNTGWIALNGGIAGGANIILLPEIQFSYEKVFDALKERKAMGKDYALIVMAEGATAMDESRSYQMQEAGREFILGGVSFSLMERLREMGSKDFEIRNLVLGHLQRGGEPNAEDRILAQRFGVAAFNAVKNKQYGQMVRLQGGEISMIPIAEAVEDLKLVTPDDALVKAARDMGIKFGD